MTTHEEHRRRVANYGMVFMYGELVIRVI